MTRATGHNLVIAAATVIATVTLLPLLHAIEIHLPAALPDRSSPEWRAREDAVLRAQVVVRRDPPMQVSDLAGGSDGLSVPDGEAIRCQYEPKPTRATSPKFDCRLPDGQVVKVKYGTLEIQAEAAGTRLLRALGFAADRTSIVPRVICNGCPRAPFNARRSFEYFYAGPLLELFLDSDRPREFDWVAIEQKFPGRAFEIGDTNGWSYGDLALIREDRGGATRAEIDGLRLISVLLGHWDSKPQNQRMVCRGEADDDSSGKPCASPLLLIHDLGSTFGTKRVDLTSWRMQPMWAGDTGCRVMLQTMRGPGTFVPAEITEEGRQWMATRLAQLTDRQIADWFLAARFPDPRDPKTVAKDVSEWVRVFREKVAQIESRRCGSGS